MSDNFKPMFWAKKCETDLKKDLVISRWCNYEYEGEFKLGSRLKIVGAVRPKIVKYKKGTKLEPESLGDNSQYLDITEADAFCYEVDDVEKAQKTGNYLSTQMDEAREALAENAERFVASKAKDALATHKSASTEITEANALSVIDDAHIKLYEKDVSNKTPLAADLNAKHTVKLRSAMNKLFTDNVENVKNGALAKYGNTFIRLTNCLFNDGTDDYEMIRTKKAIAFANRIDKIKRSDNPYGFGELIKGLHVYGAKLVRPKEMYVIRAH